MGYEAFVIFLNKNKKNQKILEKMKNILKNKKND